MRARDMESDVVRVCPGCNLTFNPPRRAIKEGKGKYCSQYCVSMTRIREIPRPVFHVPPSTKKERQRANGLINMRVRRGLMVKPDKCEKCGVHCKPVGHHEDYSKPGEVVWLCRSCHTKAHMVPVSATAS